MSKVIERGTQNDALHHRLRSNYMSSHAAGTTPKTGGNIGTVPMPENVIKNTREGSKNPLSVISVDIVQFVARGSLVIFRPFEHVGVIILPRAPEHILLHRALFETSGAQIADPVLFHVALDLA